MYVCMYLCMYIGHSFGASDTVVILTKLFEVFVQGINLFLLYKTLFKLTPEKGIHLIACIGLLIGVHGLIHLGLEYVYNYNPLINFGL